MSLEIVPAVVQSFSRGLAVCILPDRGNVTTPELQVVATRAKGDQAYDRLVEGEAVLVALRDDGASGFVLGALYNDGAPPPDGDDKAQRVFEDGTAISYDRATKTLLVDCQGPVMIKATGDVQVKATGQVKVQGATISLN